MPTVAQRFFFGTIDDDQDFPGVTENVKKLLESAPASNSTTTVTWTTTTVTEKTMIPLTANSAAGDTSSNNGWAFNDGGADGLGSVTGALRRIPAGVWNFSLQETLNTPAVLANINLTVTAKVYRVNDINAGAGGARTLLFTAQRVGTNTTSATLTWASASQPEVLLQPGEVIMVGITATSASTAALVLGANTNTVLTVVLGANSHFTVPAPGVETIANTNGSAAGTATADGTLAATGAMAGSSSGTSSADGVMSATACTNGTSDGLATVNAVIAAVSTTNGSSSGSSDANGSIAGIGAAIGTSEGTSTADGAGATVKPTAGSSAGTSDANGVLAAAGAMVGTSDGIATVLGSMGAVAEGSGTAAGTSAASGSMAAVAPTVGTVNVAEGGGGETIIIAPVFGVFD